MYLSEIAVGAGVIITININGEKLEFNTTVVESTTGYILTEPVRVQDKIVNFEKAGKEVDLIMVRKEKVPVIWKRILISTVVYKQKKYYKIRCAAVGVDVNRRGAYRLFVGEPGVVQVGFNKQAYDIIVKDVSESGFAFVIGKDIKDDGSSMVHLTFSEGTERFSLNGMVVRTVESENGKFVVGCKLTAKNLLLNRYIVKKQREKLEKSFSKRQDNRLKNAESLQKAQRRDDLLRNKMKESGPVGLEDLDMDKLDKNSRRELF